MNAYIALYRRNSVLRDWPILEVIGVAAITAAVSYLVSIPFFFQFYFYSWLSIGRLLTVSVSRWYRYLDQTIRSVQTSELVANLFQECDPTKGDYHGLCKYVFNSLLCMIVTGEFQALPPWDKTFFYSFSPHASNLF